MKVLVSITDINVEDGGEWLFVMVGIKQTHHTMDSEYSSLLTENSERCTGNGGNVGANQLTNKTKEK